MAGSGSNSVTVGSSADLVIEPWGAALIGLIAGGLGQYFRGSYATKGLYCYNNGTFNGHCYFGTGEKNADIAFMLP